MADQLSREDFAALTKSLAAAAPPGLTREEFRNYIVSNVRAKGYEKDAGKGPLDYLKTMAGAAGGELLNVGKGMLDNLGSVDSRTPSDLAQYGLGGQPSAPKTPHLGMVDASKQLAGDVGGMVKSTVVDTPKAILSAIGTNDPEEAGRRIVDAASYLPMGKGVSDAVDVTARGVKAGARATARGIVAHPVATEAAITAAGTILGGMTEGPGGAAVGLMGGHPVSKVLRAGAKWLAKDKAPAVVEHMPTAEGYDAGMPNKSNATNLRTQWPPVEGEAIPGLRSADAETQAMLDHGMPNKSSEVAQPGDPMIDAEHQALVNKLAERVELQSPADAMKGSPGPTGAEVQSERIPYGGHNVTEANPNAAGKLTGTKSTPVSPLMQAVQDAADKLKAEQAGAELGPQANPVPTADSLETVARKSEQGSDFDPSYVDTQRDYAPKEGLIQKAGETEMKAAKPKPKTDADIDAEQNSSLRDEIMKRETPVPSDIVDRTRPDFLTQDVIPNARQNPKWDSRGPGTVNPLRRAESTMELLKKLIARGKAPVSMLDELTSGEPVYPGGTTALDRAIRQRMKINGYQGTSPSTSGAPVIEGANVVTDKGIPRMRKGKK